MLRTTLLQRDYRQVLQVLRHLRRDSSLATGLRDQAAASASMRRLPGLPWKDLILGFGVAAKWTGGRPTRDMCFRFYVKAKVPNSKLKSAWRVPKLLQWGADPDGEPRMVCTDVIELPRLPQAQRTVLAGAPIGHVTGNLGSAGLAVADGTGARFLLTCTHVAAPVGSGENDAIESPPDRDGLAGPHKFGTLYAFAGLETEATNFVDAALIKPDKGIRLSNATLDLGPNPRLTDLTIAEFRQLRHHAVQRYGWAATRTGVIDGVANDLPVMIDGHRYEFSEIVRYETVSEPGDSGAAIVSLSTREVLGLHFAGDGGHGYFISGRKIARFFNVNAA